MIWIVIVKMFINQSFTKFKAVINGKTVQMLSMDISAVIYFIKKRSVTRCSIWCRLLNSFQNSENHNSRCKKWILIMSRAIDAFRASLKLTFTCSVLLMHNRACLINYLIPSQVQDRSYTGWSQVYVAE